MDQEKELLLKTLLRAQKAILNSKIGEMDSYYMDHDTPNFNIKIEITPR